MGVRNKNLANPNHLAQLLKRMKKYFMTKIMFGHIIATKRCTIMVSYLTISPLVITIRLTHKLILCFEQKRKISVDNKDNDNHDN